MGTYTSPDALYEPSAGETGWDTAINANTSIVQDRLVDLVYNVKSSDFGAIGNGTNDDTAEIAAAIAAAGSTGTVYFPPGTYKVTGLTIAANARLVGAGPRSSVLTLANSSNLPVLRFTSGATQAYVGDLGIDGNKANNTSPGGSGNQGIACEGATRLTVEHCRIVNTFNNGVEVAPGNYCRILNNEITGVGNTTTSGACAIRLFGNASVRSNDNLIQGNYLDGNVSGIFLFGNAALPQLRNQILDNIIVNCTGTSPAFGQDGGIAAQAAHDLLIANNFISANTGRGIHVFSECNGIVISGNTIRDCGVTNEASGIDVGDDNTDIGYLVSNNYVQNSGAAGIYITSCHDSTFANNVLLGNGQATGLPNAVRSGIVMNDSSGVGTYPVRDNILSGNRCFDSQLVRTQLYGIAEFSGTDTSYLRNILVANNVRDNGTAGFLTVSSTNTIEHNVT